MSSSQPTDPGSRPAPADSLQIVLLTYQPSELADDMFEAAARLARRRPGVQVVVAWGGEAGPRQDRWTREVAHWQEQGADVVLIAHTAPLERVRRALQHRKDWVLPLADDDPIGVNYLRAMADAAADAAADVVAMVASNHVKNCDARSDAVRHVGWLQADPADRLVDMLSRPGCQGTLFWGAYRHHVMAQWLAFAVALPFQASYLDQFLPHLAAAHGRIGVVPEETVLLKDDRHWQDAAASARTNARYYPHAEMSLYHEWFWTADLWRALAPSSADQRVPVAVKRWARVMFGQMADCFQVRCQAAQLTMSPAHGPVLGLLRVVGHWINEDDDPRTAAAGLDEVARMAEHLRTCWLAEGRVPDLQLDAEAPAAAELAAA